MENFITVEKEDGTTVYLNRDHITRFNQKDEYEEFDNPPKVEFYTTLGLIVGVGLAEEYFLYSENRSHPVPKEGVN